MSMQGDIATEHTVRQMCVHIEAELILSQQKPDAIVALKRVGRHALTLFDYSTPDWAAGYSEIFKE
jgi:hypothetical protein